MHSMASMKQYDIRFVLACAFFKLYWSYFKVVKEELNVAKLQQSHVGWGREEMSLVKFKGLIARG